MKAVARVAAGASLAAWFIVIVLAVLLGFSASNVRVVSEGIKVELDQARRSVCLSTKVTIINGGFFDLTNVSLRVGVISPDGEVLAMYEEATSVISAGSIKTFDVNLKPDAGPVIEALVSGKPLLIAYRTDVGVAGLIKTSAYTATGLRLEAGQIEVKS